MRESDTFSRELCSDECGKEKEKMMKKKKNYVYMMYGAIIVMIIFLIFSLMFSR